MLAGSVSVKFVGVFVVFMVGFRAIADLWDILGDLSRPVVRILQAESRLHESQMNFDFRATP